MNQATLQNGESACMFGWVWCRCGALCHCFVTGISDGGVAEMCRMKQANRVEVLPGRQWLSASKRQRSAPEPNVGLGPSVECEKKQQVIRQRDKYWRRRCLSRANQ